jgi:hypothetical protein
VVRRIAANDNRSGLRKFWDGLTGQNQTPERSIVIGRLSGQDGYLGSAILSDAFGGRKVSLADLQQAARVVNLSGVAPDQQAGAIVSQLQKAVFGLYDSETRTQDRVVGALASGMQFAVDNAKMLTPGLPPGTLDSMERAAGLQPGAEADAAVGGFVGNPNGSDYHQGKMEGEAAIMMGMALDAAFPGGIMSIRGNSLNPVGRGEPYAFGTGTRQARAEALLDEAARASGHSSALDVVDDILYNAQAGSPSFWVTPQGRRVITIDAGTFGKTEAGQLIAGTHELVHAEHFNEILAATGNLQTARGSFFVSNRTTRYAIREVMTEEAAMSRAANHLGGLSPQQVADSTKYTNFWRRRAGIE